MRRILPVFFAALIFSPFAAAHAGGYDVEHGYRLTYQASDGERRTQSIVEGVITITSFDWSPRTFVADLCAPEFPKELGTFHAIAGHPPKILQALMGEQSDWRRVASWMHELTCEHLDDLDPMTEHASADRITIRFQKPWSRYDAEPIDIKAIAKQIADHLATLP